MDGFGFYQKQTGRSSAAPSAGVTRVSRERDLLAAVGQLGDANEVLNERAVAVMKRMSHKLTGRDYSPPGSGGESSSVETQVQVSFLAYYVFWLVIHVLSNKSSNKPTWVLRLDEDCLCQRSLLLYTHAPHALTTHGRLSAVGLHPGLGGVWVRVGLRLGLGLGPLRLRASGSSFQRARQC